MMQRDETRKRRYKNYENLGTYVDYGVRTRDEDYEKRRKTVRRKQLKKRRRKLICKRLLTSGAVVSVCIVFVLWGKSRLLEGHVSVDGLRKTVGKIVEDTRNLFEAREAYQMIDERDDHADVLKELLDKNPETAEFVKNYAQMKQKTPAETIGELSAGEIPLLLQWDERWGYCSYGDNMIAVNGCGPTAVAMVASGLLEDPSITPYKVAKFAEEQGYYAGDAGTSWTLMTEGVQYFGIWGEELGLSKSEIFSALESGNPIICSMRPGDFTTTGHFIVLIRTEGEKIKVNDPNSRIRSNQLWDYERLEPQIQNLWVFSKL